MKNPFKYIVSAVRVGWIKIRFNRRIKVGLVQAFEKVRVQITNGGHAEIGSFNQNRGNLYLGVDGGSLKIGNHCFFNINGSITCLDKIEIGDYCKFGNNLVIVDHDHNFRTESPEFISSPIKIGNNVWCGANVVILKGATIGNNCVIAAGTTVRGNVPDGTILVSKQQYTFIEK